MSALCGAGVVLHQDGLSACERADPPPVSRRRHLRRAAQADPDSFAVMRKVTLSEPGGTSVCLALAECSQERAPADGAHQSRRRVKLVREREDQIAVPVNPIAGSGQAE